MVYHFNIKEAVCKIAICGQGKRTGEAFKGGYHDYFGRKTRCCMRQAKNKVFNNVMLQKVCAALL
jgi:hypothetical protein